MTTTAGSLQIVLESPPSAPALRDADRGVADALTAVLSDNTKRVYATQWKLFDEWCGEMGLHSLPAEPLTVARYLAVRAGDGASMATIRLTTSAIAKVHEWAGHESPGKARGVRDSLKGLGRRLAKPQRQAGALTADVLAVIRLTAVRNCSDLWGSTGHQASYRGAAKHGICFASRLVPSNVNSYRCPAAQARPRLRNVEAGCRAEQVRPGVSRRLVGRGVAAIRGFISHLGRCPALGRRQRPHHRGPLQDRRRGPGRRGGRHLRRHESSGRHPAGGGGRQ